MVLLWQLVIQWVRDFFRNRASLQIENLLLRHQVNVLQRHRPKRLPLRKLDRWIWCAASTFFQNWRQTLIIVKPDTVTRWHREGFRIYWKWKSRSGQVPGRPIVSREVKNLIRQMCHENPTWGAPRIHGELHKLGYQVGETSVTKYMVKVDHAPSQTWKTFLENHAGNLAAIDFFTVPTIFFKVLHVLIVLDHERRCIIHFNVTTNPTSNWVAQQIREAFPWDTAPRYIIHDNDPLFQGECRACLAGMGIESVRIAKASPWQNARCERAIGTLRRELLNRVIVLSEQRLRELLADYLEYYHHSRTHMGLGKDTPVTRPVQLMGPGEIVSTPVLGGLHHQYRRVLA